MTGGSDFPESGRGWPPSDGLSDKDAQALFAARLGDVAAQRAYDRNIDDAPNAADAATNAAEFGKYTSAMYALATASIDRTRAAADVVQKASAALAALYTGALGLVFSVTSNPLPPRGILALVFLGVAVLLSTYFVAYIGPAQDDALVSPPVGAPERAAWHRVLLFSHTTSRIATARYEFLRASVVSLGIGLLFVAAPFVSFTHESTTPAAHAAAWPAPPAGGNADLNKILYQAQVNEVAAQRSASPSPGMEGQDWIWFAGATVGLIVIGLMVRSQAASGGGSAKVDVDD